MTPQSTQEKVIEVPLSRLLPHPHNPRGPVDPASVEELAASMTDGKGILQPLLVVTHEATSEGWMTYRIVAGHRRYTAAQRAGLERAPVIVKHYSPAEQEEVMLIENLQREELTPLQEAKAYQRLKEQGLEQSEIARRLGVIKPRVSERLTILTLAPAVQELYNGFDLPTTAARWLAHVHKPEIQARLASRVANFQMTVKDLKQAVDHLASSDDATPKREQKPKTITPQPTFTRADGMVALQATEKAAWTRTELLSALEGVCQKCGMKTHPQICTQCPLPQYLRQLAEMSV